METHAKPAKPMSKIVGAALHNAGDYDVTSNNWLTVSEKGIPV